MAVQEWSHTHCPTHVVGAPDLAEQISRAGLFFVHIPKCGGTTLSKITPAHAQVLQKKPPDPLGVMQLKHWQRRWRLKSGTLRGMPSPWHLPPDMYERLFSEPFPARNQSVICVVRNPLDRFQSEVAYRKRQNHRSFPPLTPSLASETAADMRRGRFPFRWQETSLHLAPQSWYVWADSGATQCHCVVAIEKLHVLETVNAAQRSPGHQATMPAGLQELYADDLRLWELAKASPSFSIPTPGRSLQLAGDVAVPMPVPMPLTLTDFVPRLGCMNRTIWMLWEQGWDKAPPLVRLCRDAVVQLNSATWNIVLLDRAALSQWIAADVLTAAYKIKSTNPSDLVRFYLLSTLGGVWLDATILCTMPLDAWIPAKLAVDPSGMRGWIEWDDDSPRPSINFIASCPHGLLGKAAAHVVALARAGKIIDNSYHCFNREFTTGLRAHKKAIVAAQASSRPKPTHLATAPSSYCAHVGRSHLSRTRLADRRELQRQEDRAQDHEQ